MASLRCKYSDEATRFVATRSRRPGCLFILKKQHTSSPYEQTGLLVTLS